MPYHINCKGMITPCRATVQECPLGGIHGATPEAVEKALVAGYSTVPPARQKELTPLPPSAPFPAVSPVEKDFWNKVEKSMGLFVHSSNFFIPGSLTGSVYYCFGCYARLPQDTAYAQVNWKVQCPTCGEANEDGLTGVTLKPESHAFFYEAAVREADWYHFSAAEAWDERMASGAADLRVVHLGTKEASLDRQRQSGSGAGKLYRVRLKTDAAVASTVLDEDPYNGEPAPLASTPGVTRGITVAGVTRYMNAYEDPGSISLIANPASFTIAEVTEV